MLQPKSAPFAIRVSSLKYQTTYRQFFAKKKNTPFPLVTTIYVISRWAVELHQFKILLGQNSLLQQFLSLRPNLTPYLVRKQN